MKAGVSVGVAGLVVGVIALVVAGATINQTALQRYEDERASCISAVGELADSVSALDVPPEPMTDETRRQVLEVSEQAIKPAAFRRIGISCLENGYLPDGSREAVESTNAAAQTFATRYELYSSQVVSIPARDMAADWGRITVMVTELYQTARNVRYNVLEWL
jgi:hypothetical protein